MGLLSRKPKLKPVGEQTIVITGASSGIGLATARLAAERGARVVLTSRNEEDLRRACDEIRNRGGRAIYAVADVAVPEAMDRVADTATREFGGFDTWVNNAGVSIYGSLTEVSLEDKRKLFETNFWASCTAAAPPSGICRSEAASSSTSVASFPTGLCRCSRSTPHRSTRCRVTRTVCGWNSSTTTFRFR
jgi:NAD(P)-dependent dehydrogenase (short-subunit alcohol dehydrogenase family)